MHPGAAGSSHPLWGGSLFLQHVSSQASLKGCLTAMLLAPTESLPLFSQTIFISVGSRLQGRIKQRTAHMASEVLQETHQQWPDFRFLSCSWEASKWRRQRIPTDENFLVLGPDDHMLVPTRKVLFSLHICIQDKLARFLIQNEWKLEDSVLQEVPHSYFLLQEQDWLQGTDSKCCLF